MGVRVCGSRASGATWEPDAVARVTALPFFIGLLGLLLFHESIRPAMAPDAALIMIGALAITTYEEHILKWWERKRAAQSA